VKHIIKGRILVDGGRGLYVDGKRLNLQESLKVRDHSPTGFSWGYGGSGPAQTALAILLALVSKEEALKHYQSFKWDLISRMSTDNDFTLKLDIDNCIRQYNENTVSG